MMYCLSGGRAGCMGMFFKAGGAIQFTKKSADNSFCSLSCLYVIVTPVSPCLMDTMGQFNHTREPSLFAKALGSIWLPSFNRKTSGGASGTPRRFNIPACHKLNNADELLPPKKPSAVLEAPSFL